ncbi:unnamed protein product [Rhizophagus irregularis]|nr:unnamed protein product [Rhizophagus irregularis]
MANGKSLEEKDMDSFLLEAHKKIVSSEIKQCNKEKKLLRESAFLKVLPSAGNNPTVSSGNDKIESSTKTVSSGNDQMVSEKSEKIEKTSRNQQKVIQDFDDSDEIELTKNQNIELDLIRDLQSGSIIASLSEISEQYSSSCEASYGQITTQSLIHLFRNATRAGHEEILSWVHYSDNFENEVVEIRRETGVTDKTARTQIYKEMLEHLAGVTPVALRIKTLRAKKVRKIVWREWYQVTSKTVSLGNDQSHVPSKTTNGDASSKLASTAPIPSTHVSAEGAKGNNSSNDSSRNGSKNIPKANDDLMPTSMEKRTNEVKRSLREASKRRDQTDDDSDCSHDSDSEEERLDDSDDGYDGYGGYGGYDGYDEWGNRDRGYYYRNGRRERKTFPMMSPIISPFTSIYIIFSFIETIETEVHVAMEKVGRKCCGKPELSVMVGGDITGLDYDEMSERIKATMKFDFVHVHKKKDKGIISVVYKMDTETANTGTSTSVIESDHNDINEY